MRDYETKIRGEIIEVSFDHLVKQAQAGQAAALQIKDWMCVGPFVMETGGMFETEYMHEREKILLPDYLSSCGGEKNVTPYLDEEINNSYLGPSRLKWTRSVQKWNGIRFDGQSSDCDDAVYLTDQRNAVYYAAVYIRCTQPVKAVVNYENSGCYLFLNGRLISRQPYGRLRGIADNGYAVTAGFSAGLNLLLFKIRPGYICDALDIAIAHCSIYPLAFTSTNLGLTYPAATDIIFRDNPLARLYPCFAAALADCQGGEVKVQGKSYEIPAMARGQCRLLRLFAADEQVSGLCQVSLTEKGMNGETTANGHFRASIGKYSGTDVHRLIFSVFHFDTTYHQEQRVYAMGALHNLKSIVGRLRENPDFKATISEIDYLHPYYVTYPEDRDDLRRFFQEGRAEADCFYNQPNEMTSSGEALVRNLLYGQLYHREVMGRKTFIYNPFDVFGHCNQISQICAKGDCDGIAWGKLMFGLEPVFRYMSPDGTSLVHTHGTIDEGLAKQLRLPACHYGENPQAPNMPAYPQESDTAWIAETLPAASFAVQSDWQKKVLSSSQSSANLATTSRDISLYHAGTALTRTDLKQANRLCENLLISAEKLSVIAALHGARYPEKALDKAWRQVLCGQHHDSLTGTNNEISFADLLIQYREALEIAAGINNRATAYIGSLIKVKPGMLPLFVFNTHAWARTGQVCLSVRNIDEGFTYRLIDSQGSTVDAMLTKPDNREDGKFFQIRFRASVPAMGYTTYYLEKAENKAKSGNITAQELKIHTESQDCHIENEYFILTVDPAAGGGIISLYDKNLQKELIRYDSDGPANRVVALKELRDRRETQHEFYTTGYIQGAERQTAKVKSEKCALFSRLYIDCPLGNIARLHQEITLYAGSRRIDFQLRIDGYDQEDDLFCVTFPTSLRGVVPVFDDRFAPQVRNQSRKSLDFRTHQMMMFSHCAVYAANQWLDYGPSVTLRMQASAGQGSINIGMSQIIRHAQSRLDKSVAMLLEGLTKKAVPVTVYPDTKQTPLKSRIVHFNEDLIHDTRFVLSIDREENEYEAALWQVVTARTQTAFSSELRTRGIAVLYCQDSANDWQKPVDVFLLKARTREKLDAFVQTLCEQLQKGRFLDLRVCTDELMSPADDYGIALINSGNIACSVEKDGLLNLMLFHTAEFYGNIGKTNCGTKLVPEQKSHVFTYALYPHSGSYREAQIYKRAFEFNDPLRARADISPGEAPVLPESGEYLRLEGKAVVTAAKAGDAPSARLRSVTGDLVHRGICVRLFETDGQGGKVILHSGFKLAKAKRTNLLEEEARLVDHDSEKINFELGAHAIETIVLSPDKQDSPGEFLLAPETETLQPVYVRSWEYDLGSMPMGFLAVTGVIGRQPRWFDDLSFITDVYMSNSYTDRAIRGKMDLQLPAGWKASTCEFNYDLESGRHEKYSVKITRPYNSAEGLLRLLYDHDGQIFEDIYAIGRQKAKIRLLPCNSGYVAEITNFSSFCLCGSIYLASPIETWGGMGESNPFALAELGNWRQKVDLHPLESRKYLFPYRGSRNVSYYAIAKLCLNGNIYFAGTKHFADRRAGSAEEYLQKIEEDAGSLAVINNI